jgi:Fe-S oxidoreductase
LETLAALGVSADLNVDLAQAGFLDRCLKENDAVFLSMDAIPGEIPDLKWDAAGSIIIEPHLQSTQMPRVYAGGGTDTCDCSSIRQAAEGRWAATSIDRLLQGVSLTAGREKDGPYKTRLFTSLEGIQPSARIEPADPIAGYSLEEAVTEASRCLKCECLECVKVCAYLERFGAYPRKYAREIYNNESIVMGMHQANKLINSCSLCGLCERVCPESFAMQDLCLQTRRNMVRRGKMPPSTHEFALQDMHFSLSERFHLVRHAPGRTESAHAFFPGCQLCASAPGQVQRVYSHLMETLPGGVGLILGCCGAPASWAGREEEFAGVCAGFLKDWDALGRPELIVACSTCFGMFSEHLPQVRTTSLWQVLERTGLPPQAGATAGSNLAIHDPCTTRPYPGIQEAVRRLTKRLGVSTEELALGRDLTECCGFGGLMQNANPELSQEVVARRARRSPSDYLVYCAMCRDSLAGAGKRAVHILDLIFPDPGAPDPAQRRRPGWSERQENRARIRSRLLETLWAEETHEMLEHENISLIIATEIAALLEKRRILLGDVRRVIHEAERSGHVVAHPRTGHLKACHRPFRTTIWVEYTPTPEGYVVHSAYTHRMDISGGTGS